ncbi:MAG: hypothetical protein FRX49_06324 [Trebouxia sp. A1-2]|nr:MAG: hypothetical protein FRX49_06324 [Trebouxia sp. A1-2]
MIEMRRRQAVSVEELLQEPYLDAEEQKEVVHRLKQQHARQSRQWTTVFAVLAVVLGMGCLYLSWHQLRDPWGLRHHAFFSGAKKTCLEPPESHLQLAGFSPNDDIIAIKTLRMLAALPQRVHTFMLNPPGPAGAQSTCPSIAAGGRPKTALAFASSSRMVSGDTVLQSMYKLSCLG